MPIHPATASRAPALHRTITRLLHKAGAIISPVRSNAATPMFSVRLHRQHGAAHTAAQAVQVAKALLTVARAHQVAVQADLLAVVQEAHVVQEVL